LAQSAFAHGSVTNLASPEARAILAIAPTPAAGARLSPARIATALRRAGRKRGITALAARIHQALRTPQLRQPPLVENAMGHQVSALLATLATECANADHLTAAATEAFTQHPDHDIITSFPGLADLTGARVLAEIGDDRTRFTDARALKAYAGSAPVTRASGRSISITRRRIKNDRLNAVGFLWAFATLGCPAFSGLLFSCSVMPQAADSCIDCGLRAVSDSQALNAIADDYRTVQYIGQCLLSLSSGSDTPCDEPARFSGYRKKTQQARCRNIIRLIEH
jgi:hypothetical protein